MKMYQIDIEIYYNGPLSKKYDIGHLTLQLEMDEEPLIKTSNTYDTHPYDHFGKLGIIPVNISEVLIQSAKVVKEENIKDKEYHYASFKYEIEESVVTFRTRGTGVEVYFKTTQIC